MSEHPREHEELLAALLAGETDAAEPAAAQRLRECAHCREELERLRASATRLEQAGAERRANLAELARMGPVVGEDRMLATLTRAEGEGPRAERGSRRSFLWLAAAAAAVLVVGTLVARRFLAGDAPPVTLGDTEFEEMSPSGPGSSFERFSWKYTGTTGERFVLRIWEQKDGPRGDPLRILETKETSWTPEANERQALPARIVWEVEARDAFGGNSSFSPAVRASR